MYTTEKKIFNRTKKSGLTFQENLLGIYNGKFFHMVIITIIAVIDPMVSGNFPRNYGRIVHDLD